MDEFNFTLMTKFQQSCPSLVTTHCFSLLSDYFRTFYWKCVINCKLLKVIVHLQLVYTILSYIDKVVFLHRTL